MLDPEILSATSSILRPLKFLHSCAKHHARTVLSCVDFDIFYFELLDPEILTNDTQDKVSRKIRTTTRYVRIFFAEECRKLKKNNTKDTDDRKDVFPRLLEILVFKGNATPYDVQGLSIYITQQQLVRVCHGREGGRCKEEPSRRESGVFVGSE